MTAGFGVHSHLSLVFTPPCWATRHGLRAQGLGCGGSLKYRGTEDSIQSCSVTVMGPCWKGQTVKVGSGLSWPIHPLLVTLLALALLAF